MNASAKIITYYLGGIIIMQKKNPIIGAVLGFFILGLPYSGGVKKGLIALVVLCIVSSAIASLGMPILCIIPNLVGAYLGHTWTNEYNAAIDGQLSTTTETM